MPEHTCFLNNILYCEWHIHIFENCWLIRETQFQIYNQDRTDVLLGTASRIFIVYDRNDVVRWDPICICFWRKIISNRPIQCWCYFSCSGLKSSICQMFSFIYVKENRRQLLLQVWNQTTFKTNWISLGSQHKSSGNITHHWITWYELLRLALAPQDTS